MTAPKELFRILDANFNRAKEGLRVCEDISRYVWDETALTRDFKTMRHKLTTIIEAIGVLKVLANRNIAGDVGRASTKSELGRKDLSSVFWANSQRVKESLRVLEEITKLLNTKASSQIKLLRYQIYATEQKALKRL